MKKFAPLPSMTVAVLVCLIAGEANTGSAALVDLTNSSAGSTSWEIGANWSDGLPAQSGNDYRVGFSPTGKYLRTPESAAPVFPGDSLTVYSTGTLAMKHSGNAQIADLRLDGGTIACWVGNRTFGFDGNLTVLSSSSLSITGASDSRRIVIASLLAGSGNLTVAGSDGNDWVRLTNSANTYTGNWTITGGWLEAQGAGSLGSGNVTINNGSLDVSGNQTISALNLNDGTATVSADFTTGDLIVALNGKNATLTATGASFQVGSGAETLDIGRRATASTSHTHGTVDLSNAASVAINVANLRLGTITNVSQEGDTQGILTLSLAGANTVTATNITVGDSPARGNTDFTSEINLGGAANAINVDTMYIGRRKSHGLVDIAAGGSLTLRDKAGTGRADLYVARNDTSTGASILGTMDLSGGTSFDALFDVLAIGDKGSSSQNGKATGILTLAQTNTIDANSIVVGRSGNTGATGAADQSKLHLGGGINTILTPSLLVGDRKTTGLIDFATPGGTLNLGTAIARTEITLGRKSVNTANNAAGTMDLRDGTANIFASDINLGQETNTGGTGTPSGTIWLGDGSLDVSGNIHENHASGGAGNSTLNVVGTQTFNVGGYIAVDSFVVGLNGTPATVTFTGATAQIGTPSHSTDLFVGRRTANTSTTFQGTLDLSGVTTFTAYLDEFGVGTVPGSVGSSQGQPRGVVTLATNNTIDARIITIGDSPSVGLGGFNNRIVLGATNAIAADTLIVGGNKSSGTIGGTLEFGTGGGTLDLGTVGDPVNVTVGRQTVGTGSGAAGHLDMSGGTFNAYIDQLIVGTKPNTASGTTKGAVTFEAGTVDVDTIILGQRTAAGASGVVQGTFHFAGGTLYADNIQKGAYNGNNAGDVAHFDWTGGTLHVGAFGQPAWNFDLDQNGGTLAPDSLTGDPIGTTTVQGDYSQNAGELEIEIRSAGAAGVDYDLLVVEGNTPGGDLRVDLLGYEPGLGDFFDVLEVAGGIAPGDWSIVGDSAGAHSWTTTLLDRPGGGNILRLTAVPEPSTLALAVLGLLALAGCLRRRRG